MLECFFFCGEVFSLIFFVVVLRLWLPNHVIPPTGLPCSGYSHIVYFFSPRFFFTVMTEAIWTGAETELATKENDIRP